jgi:hypothetical protein
MNANASALHLVEVVHAAVVEVQCLEPLERHVGGEIDGRIG